MAETNRIRWWPGLAIAILGALAFALMRVLDVWPYEQARSLALLATAAGTGLLLLLWWLFFSRATLRMRLVPLLAPHYRLLLVAFLGFGFSDKPRPYTYSLFEQAALAEEVAARRGLTEVALLAHDMGSSVALVILQRAPNNAELAKLRTSTEKDGSSLMSAPTSGENMRLRSLTVEHADLHRCRPY